MKYARKKQKKPQKQFLVFILNEAESNNFYLIYVDEIFCMKIYWYINCFKIKKKLATPISYAVLNVIIFFKKALWEFVENALNLTFSAYFLYLCPLFFRPIDLMFRTGLWGFQLCQYMYLWSYMCMIHTWFFMN